MVNTTVPFPATEHIHENTSRPDVSKARTIRTIRTIAYWATTAVVVFALLAGGIADLVGVPAVTATMLHLGYPAYLATLLGVWKILGAAALLAPGLPRLKEWAYAGIMFDLTGAAISHGVVGDGVGAMATPLVVAMFAAASWALRPARRTLAAATSQPGLARPRPAVIPQGGVAAAA